VIILFPERLISSIEARSGISSSILSILLFSRLRCLSFERSLKPPKTVMLLLATSSTSKEGRFAKAASDLSLFSVNLIVLRFGCPVQASCLSILLSETSKYSSFGHLIAGSSAILFEPISRRQSTGKFSSSAKMFKFLILFPAIYKETKDLKFPRTEISTMLLFVRLSLQMKLISFIS